MERTLTDDEIDEMCEVLCNSQRRKVLIALVERDSQDVSTMADVPWDVADTEGTALRKRHVHLPKLADSGFIEWDREADVATQGPRFDEIRPLLEVLETRKNELLVE